MAKQSGLGWTTCSVDDSGSVARAIKNDVTNLAFATPRGVQDITGIDKSAYERLLLLADASGSLNGVFNPAATTTSHAVFSTVPSTSVARLITLTVGGVTLAVTAIFTDYSLTRGNDGALTWTAPFVLSSGTVPTWA